MVGEGEEIDILCKAKETPLDFGFYQEKGNLITLGWNQSLLVKGATGVLKERLRPPTSLMT